MWLNTNPKLVAFFTLLAIFGVIYAIRNLYEAERAANLLEKAGYDGRAEIVRSEGRLLAWSIIAAILMPFILLAIIAYETQYGNF